LWSPSPVYLYGVHALAPAPNNASEERQSFQILSSGSMESITQPPNLLLKTLLIRLVTQIAGPRGIAIADVSVVHLLSTNLLHRASTTAGAEASHPDQQNRTTYAWLELYGYELVPVSSESYRRFRQPAMKLLHTLGKEAANPGDPRGLRGPRLLRVLCGK
jgi:hypothetical protein